MKDCCQISIDNIVLFDNVVLFALVFVVNEFNLSRKLNILSEVFFLTSFSI